MKVILNKDVPNLGEEGDVRDVARGYARNFLIPQGFGSPFTKQNIAMLKGRQAVIEKRKSEKREAALGLKQRIEELSLVIEMTAGDSGKLFGSVTSATIMDELVKVGIQVERKKIEITEHAIKSTGNHVVKIKLYGNETAQLKVQVSASKKQEEKAEAAKPREAKPKAAPAVPAQPEAPEEATTQE